RRLLAAPPRLQRVVPARGPKSAPEGAGSRPEVSSRRGVAARLARGGRQPLARRRVCPARILLRHPRSLRAVRDSRGETREQAAAVCAPAVRADDYRMSRPLGVLGWVELSAALLSTGLLLALNVHFSTHAGPLWRDEVSTLQLATRPTY